MFQSPQRAFDEGVFRYDNHTRESPPTPAEMFRNIALMLGAVVYMVCVILLLATVLIH